MLIKHVNDLQKSEDRGHVVDIDLILCTGFNSEHVDLFLCISEDGGLGFRI